MIKINYIKKNDTVFSCINTLQFLLLNIAGLQLIRLIYKMRCHTQLYKASICFKQVKGFKYILAEGLKVMYFFINNKELHFILSCIICFETFI